MEREVIAMSQGSDFLEELKKLRKGEQVVCSVCHEGHLVTKHDPKTSHFFYCDKCGAKLNIN